MTNSVNNTLIRTPPSRWYFDEDIAADERKSVFSATWQPVARVDQLSTKGQFVTAEIAGEPLLVVRGEAIRAFFNVCRHHAAQVVNGESGCLKKLHCPYHGWTYSLDGNLLTAPYMEAVEGFDPAEHGLVPLRVEAWENWIWVCLDRQTPSLQQQLGDMIQAVEPLGLKKLSFFESRSYDIACNWKVFVDNYLDGGYHVPFIHRGLTTVLDNRNYQVKCGARHVLQSCPVRPANSPESAVRSGDMAYYWWLYPNFMINWYEGVMDTHWVLPLGPERCRVICDYWFDDVTREASERNRASVEVADQVQMEDVAISESVQRGLHSQSYDTGPLCPCKEQGEAVFHKLLRADLVLPTGR
jgi:choline monooxygenase